MTGARENLDAEFDQFDAVVNGLSIQALVDALQMLLFRQIITPALKKASRRKSGLVGKAGRIPRCGAYAGRQDAHGLQPEAVEEVRRRYRARYPAQHEGGGNTPGVI